MMNLYQKFLDTVPRVEYFPEYDSTGVFHSTCADDPCDGISCAGIRALAFDGADYGEKHTKVFAHISFPGNVDYPVPAVVLIHGGGGHPEDIWIKKWNERGYAAIAMDTTGFFPTKPIPYLSEGSAEGMARELTGPFVEENYTVAPDNSRMRDARLPIEKQWMYHAVAQVILAHNILRNDKRIDKDKIGISGISWGGVIASIAIGFDTRFAFAVPIYGSGHLGCGSGSVCDVFRNPEVMPWLAEKRFSQVHIPVLWLCWNDDKCFSINSNSLSYYDTKDNNPNTCISIKHEMFHSHYSGYMPLESYWFADKIVKGEHIPTITSQYNDKNLSFSCSQKPQTVKLFYKEFVSGDKHTVNGRFINGEWKIVDINPDANSVILPGNAFGSYLEFTFEDGIVLSTPYSE